MLAEGRSLTEVARDLNHARQTLSTLWAQPWFRSMIADTMDRAAASAWERRFAVSDAKPEPPLRALERLAKLGVF